MDSLVNNRTSYCYMVLGAYVKNVAQYSRLPFFLTRQRGIDVVALSFLLSILLEATTFKIQSILATNNMYKLDIWTAPTSDITS